MYLRIFKVSWFMFVCLIQFTWRRLTHAKNQDGLLDQDYRDWSAYVLRVFDIDLSVSHKHRTAPNGLINFFPIKSGRLEPNRDLRAGLDRG